MIACQVEGHCLSVYQHYLFNLVRMNLWTILMLKQPSKFNEYSSSCFDLDLCSLSF